jgi:hypothetical protein
MIPGLVMMNKLGEEERSYVAHMAQDRSSPEARAKAVAVTERILFERIRRERESRMRASWWFVGGGAALMAGGLVFAGLMIATRDQTGSLTSFLSPVYSGLLLGAGAAYLALGLVMRTAVAKSPMERMWDLYEASENGEAPATQPASLEWSVAPFVAPGERGGFNAGFGGSLKF